MRRLGKWMMLVVLVTGCGKKSEYPDAKVPYIVETLSMPTGLHAETGGIAFLPDGRLVACFLTWRGDDLQSRNESVETFCRGITRAARCLALE